MTEKTSAQAAPRIHTSIARDLGVAIVSGQYQPGAVLPGEIEFSALGEWKQERNLFVQFQNITDGDLEKYKKPGTKVILYPPALKSGTLHTPYGTPA